VKNKISEEIQEGLKLCKPNAISLLLSMMAIHRSR